VLLYGTVCQEKSAIHWRGADHFYKTRLVPADLKKSRRGREREA
jgi:hypothetical protein